jgi:site-specific DNA-methyltransferase (adenine-specific)
MDTLYNHVKNNEEAGIEFTKTVEEWEQYKVENGIGNDDTHKENYLKYGTTYGKKYCVRTDFGDWEQDFTIEILDKFVAQFYEKLKKGGTLIIFFDIWKISVLKEILERHKFKQIRFIEWIKTNPQPLNSRVNYLTNCREIALLGVKGGSPTFNGSYDNGIYRYPIQSGKNRFHPTQKNIDLFVDLINKHSNEGDTVLDTFLGGGTTALACLRTNRKFKGCDMSKEYYDKVMEIIDSL